MAKIRVFVDTNVILEAFRTGCWSVLSERFAIETVEKCIEETLTGNPNDPRHIPVEATALASGLAARHEVKKRDIAALVLGHSHCQGLDDGELHLLAWIQAQGLLPDARILVSTADKAAIVACAKLEWLDAVISLEELARQSGSSKLQLDRLAKHYHADWLANLKTKIRLGVIS